MKGLFDTNILIDYLNGIKAAKQEIDRYPSILISTISWMEILVGTTKTEEPSVRNFLSRFQHVALSPPVAERAVEIRRNTGIRLPDAIIQASAQVENALLISRNTRDFSEDDPSVRVPYRL